MDICDKEKSLSLLNPAWELSFNNTRLRRSFTFCDFKSSLGLANAISIYAEEVNHHPEIHFGWGHLEVEIWTHTENDVLPQDFSFAEKVDELSGSAKTLSKSNSSN